MVMGHWATETASRQGYTDQVYQAANSGTGVIWWWIANS